MTINKTSGWNARIGTPGSSTPDPYSSYEDSEDGIMEFTDVIGGYGPWQRNLFVLLFLASIPSTWHNLMMTFMAPNMDYWCARPPELVSKVSITEWRNITAPGGSLDSCQMVPYTNETYPRASATLKCTSWEYNTTFYQSTVVNEWDLVCDRDWLISLSKSIYNVGYLAAVLLFGQISDSLGRRPTLLVSFVINVVAGILSAFSNSYAMFVVLRFFTAIGAAGFYTVSFVLLMEVVSPVNRSMVGIAINFGWCLAFISLPAVAWIVRDWFWLQLAVTLPKLLFFSVFWVVPESPRWLLTQNKEDQFRDVLIKAAKKNGKNEVEADREINKLLVKSDKGNLRENFINKETVFDLLKTPELRKNTLNLYFNWLVNSFIYYGLSYNTDDLTGDPYLSFFASGAVEFPAYLLTIYVIKARGRRIPLTAAMVAGGVACALTIPIPDELFWLKVSFSLIGKFFVTASFATVYVYSAEIFPTVVRNVGVGTGSTCARVGSILAPFVRELGAATNPTIPQIIFSALSILSGLLILLLPETNNTRFTNTLEEAEKFGRSARRQNIASTCREKFNVFKSQQVS